MSSYIVYLDHENAKIFKMIPGQKTELNLHKHVKLNHLSNQVAKKKDPSSFFQEVEDSLNDASEILILGHGNAKEQFVHHLNDHPHNALAKKIVGVEAVDKPTDK